MRATRKKSSKRHMTPLEKGLALSARKYMKTPIHIIAEALHRDHRTIAQLMHKHGVKK